MSDKQELSRRIASGTTTTADVRLLARVMADEWASGRACGFEVARIGWVSIEVAALLALALFGVGVGLGAWAFAVPAESLGVWA